MKEYFLDLLNNLDKLAGLRQVEKIMASSLNPKAEINELIAVLIRVSEQFPFIPMQDQKNIISAAVITDPEFNSLNARIVYKWLATHKDKYFKEQAHIQQEQAKDWVPLTGEARQEKLKEWQKALEGFDDHQLKGKFVPYADVREIEPGKEGIQYKASSAEAIRKNELHRQYCRENYDPRTAKKKATWISEEEWILKQGE